jgi:tetratricopeptide (TPR) repeat protein
MSARTDVLLWAQRVLARKDALPNQILEIAPDAGLDAAQEAFHKIARLAHPDLHRTTLSPDELEQVTTAYSRAAAAYQEVRSHRLPISPTSRMRAIRPDAAPVAQTAVIPTSPSAHKAVTVTIPLPGDVPVNPAHAMTSKALIYYRKAELCLRRGELTSAVLQLKMAIASDPESMFLRTALSEVEGEVAKKPR